MTFAEFEKVKAQKMLNYWLRLVDPRNFVKWKLLRLLLSFMTGEMI